LPKVVLFKSNPKQRLRHLKLPLNLIDPKNASLGEFGVKPVRKPAVNADVEVNVIPN
jgi:hypothetical protein